MKIAMFTLSYNTEKWIYPFLKLTPGLDKRIVLQGKTPFGEHHSTTPDRSEALIRKHFPDVEIVYQQGKGITENFNQGLDLLRDYDFVLRFDADELFLPSDWEYILQTVSKTPLDSLKYDFGNSIIYYNTGSFTHGLHNMQKEWIETRGINPKHNFGDFGSFGGGGLYIKDRTMHHFSGWKGEGIGGLSIPEDKLLEQFGEQGKYLHVPSEIQDIFQEGWRLLDTL